jgi:4-phytase/acid phosphatase
MKTPLALATVLALGVCVALPLHAEMLQPPGLRLDKVVLVMRHGIRPATDTAQLQAWSARTWPAFAAADGQLTAHGRAATVLLGRWQRQLLDQLGLFKPGECPATDAFVWSSPVPRAQATAAALVEGLFADCEVPVHHGLAREDRLFHASENGLAPLDPKHTYDAMLEAMGGSAENARNQYQGAARAMQQWVGVPDPCAGASCAFSEQPWTLVNTGSKAKLASPLSIGAAMSETIRMEYAEGMPLDQVGFGHVKNADDVAQAMALRSGKYAYSHHLPYVAQRGASQLLGQVLLALQPGDTSQAGGPPAAKWLAYVGHDSNISELRTLLGFDWKIAQYPENDSAPGGTLLFERWIDDRSGQRYVSLSYVAQSLDQLRNLATTPPYQVQFPGIAGVAGGALMPLDGFENALQARLDHSAVEPQHYQNTPPQR